MAIWRTFVNYGKINWVKYIYECLYLPLQVLSSKSSVNPELSSHKQIFCAAVGFEFGFRVKPVVLLGFSSAQISSSPHDASSVHRWRNSKMKIVKTNKNTCTKINAKHFPIRLIVSVQPWMDESSSSSTIIYFFFEIYKINASMCVYTNKCHKMTLKCAAKTCSSIITMNRVSASNTQ